MYKVLRNKLNKRCVNSAVKLHNDSKHGLHGVRCHVSKKEMLIPFQFQHIEKMCKNSYEKREKEDQRAGACPTK